MKKNLSLPLLRSTTPMLVALGTMAFVGGMEAYFVGRLGVRELTAFGFIVAFTGLALNILSGFSIGITACVARTAGLGDTARLQRVCTEVALVALAFLMLLVLAGWLMQSVVFRALNAPDDLLPTIEAYMHVWFAGLLFQGIVLFGTAVLRGVGAMNASGNLLMLASLANLVFAPMLMFGTPVTPAFGFRGAAMAIVGGMALAAVGTVAVLARRRLFAVLPESWSTLREAAAQLMPIGIPAMVSYTFAPLGLMLLTGLIAGYGRDEVAAFGVAARVQALVLIPPLAIASAVGPFVGMNLGAGHNALACEGARHGARLALVWGAIAWVILAACAHPLGRLFSSDDTVVSLFAVCMPILAAAFAPASFLLVVSSALNAANLAPRAMVLLFLRGIGVSIPLAWWAGWFWGFPGVLAGFALASLAIMVVARFWLARLFWAHDIESGIWKVKTQSENT